MKQTISQEKWNKIFSRCYHSSTVSFQDADEIKEWMRKKFELEKEAQ